MGPCTAQIHPGGVRMATRTTAKDAADTGEKKTTRARAAKATAADATARPRRTYAFPEPAPQTTRRRGTDPLPAARRADA